MQLIFRTENDTRRADWAEYALLRDNVQHYVECGSPRAEFGTLHALEKVVDAGLTTVNAIALRRELQCAWNAVGGLKLEQSAVSLRTRAIVTGCASAPAARATVLAKLAGWSLPILGPDEQSLQEAIRPFFDAVMAITRDACRDDALMVCREPHAGVTNGDLGAPGLEHPPATIGAFSKEASGVGGTSTETTEASGPFLRPPD